MSLTLMNMMRNISNILHDGWRLIPLVAAAWVLTGCGNRYHFPPGDPGWHSPDYSIVLGVLRESISHPNQWTIRYARIATPDTYGGKFVLTPTRLLKGYATGELVEITGHPLPHAKNTAGTRYFTTSIRLWLGVGRSSYLTR